MTSLLYIGERRKLHTHVTTVTGCKTGDRSILNTSKASYWQNLVDGMNGDPCGLGYKLVSTNIGALPKPAALYRRYFLNIFSLFTKSARRIQHLPEI